MTITDSTQLQRRLFLKLAGFSVPAGWLLQAPLQSATGKKMVRIAEFNSSGVRTGIVEVEKISKPVGEWKQQLSPEQSEVARKAGTERAFTGKYADNHATGLYTCICCNTVLFHSKTKFESGTGWPSFWQPIAKENVSVRQDNSLGMQRDEVLLQPL